MSFVISTWIGNVKKHCIRNTIDCRLLLFCADIRTSNRKKRLVWLKNFQYLSPTITYDTEGRIRHLSKTIKFKTIELEDSGVFTHLVINKSGLFTYNVNVTVKQYCNSWFNLENPNAVLKLMLLLSFVVCGPILLYQFVNSDTMPYVNQM